MKTSVFLFKFCNTFNILQYPNIYGAEDVKDKYANTEKRNGVCTKKINLPQVEAVCVGNKEYWNRFLLFELLG